MEQKRHIGYEVRETNNMIKRYIDNVRARLGYDDVSFAQGGVTRYLYNNSNQPVYQRDLEIRFGIRRSTVTGILQGLEKNGYIDRLSVPGDGRMKQIILTEKGRKMEEDIRASMEHCEGVFRKNLDEEEVVRLLGLMEKIRANIREEEETYDQTIVSGSQGV